MALYTIVFDFRGGTYVSQVAAADPASALAAWVKATNSQHLRELSESERDILAEKLFESPLVRVDGVRNVWCQSAAVHDALALLHLIDTCP